MIKKVVATAAAASGLALAGAGVATAADADAIAHVLIEAQEPFNDFYGLFFQKHPRELMPIALRTLFAQPSGKFTFFVAEEDKEETVLDEAATRTLRNKKKKERKLAKKAMAAPLVTELQEID